MRVLVTGANGFIGAHLAAALVAAGHAVCGTARDVVRARRQFPAVDWIQADFNRDTEPEIWRGRLDGIDGIEAVVNCAGILQAGADGNPDAVHRAAPAALFAACRECGVGRVVQISALGIDAAETEYARSKRAGDAALMATDLDWLVVRPSLVVATGGSHGGTSLLRGLAGFPLVMPLAGGGDQVFQPLLAEDLARAVARLVEADAATGVILDAVGPAPMTVAEIVRALRGWLGLPPAPLLAVPMAAVRGLARLGDLAGRLGAGGPLRTTSLEQMRAPNVADPEPFAIAAGFRPRDLAAGLAAAPSHIQDRWHARLYFAVPLLRIALGLFVLATGLLTFLPESLATGREILGRAGLSAAAGTAVMAAAGAVDVGLGLMILLRRRTVLACGLLLALSAGYLLALGTLLPGAWADPLGPLTKTLVIMAALPVVMATEGRR